jgi:nitrogen regulatory protein PII
MPNEAVPPADLWTVMAVIQRFRLDPVTMALEQLPEFGGMTVTDCRGFGRGRVASEAGAGDATATTDADGPRRRSTDSGLVDFTPKVRLEIAVAGRTTADAVVSTISRAAHTGRRGDGKVFAWPIARAVRVRTFEPDASAL